MKHTVALETKSRVPPALQQGQERRLPYFAIYCRKTKRPNSRLGITTGLKLGNAGEAQPRPPPYPGALPHQ